MTSLPPILQLAYQAATHFFGLTHQQIRVSAYRVSAHQQALETHHIPRLRIIQLSDLHFYEYTDSKYYQHVLHLVYEAVDQANQQQIATLVAITGDTIHHGPQYLHKACEWLQQLPQPCITIMGNHDYKDGHGGEWFKNHLLQAGIPLLINEARPYTDWNTNYTDNPSSPLWIVGFDDYYAGNQNVTAALSQVPSSALVIGLAHNPLHLNLIAKAHTPTHPSFPTPHILLSGHTHAGQVYLPWLGPIYRYGLQHQYRYGWHQHPLLPTQLYVNSGVSSVAFYPTFLGKAYPLPPFRWNTWPEVAVIDIFD
ncbi:MAG: metallophosphoesterase [Vampirovibrionales bacterium]